jgi:hypothetical protein
MKRLDIQRPKAVFELAHKLAQKRFGELDNAPPRQGHPWVYPHSLYAALLIFRAYFGLTYRHTVALFKDLYPESPCPSFQSLQRYMSRNLKPEDLEGLLAELKNQLERLLPDDAVPLVILDTTGIAHRGLTQKLNYKRGAEVRRVRGHSRLGLLVRYYRDLRLLVIDGVAAGPAYASDMVLGRRALRQGTKPGPLLADAGFDSVEIWKEAFERGYHPQIRLKGGEVKSELRKLGQKLFEPFLYRFRGVGEGVFGGIKTRLNGPVRELKPKVALKRVLLEAICYDLRILLTLILFALLPARPIRAEPVPSNLIL